MQLVATKKKLEQYETKCKDLSTKLTEKTRQHMKLHVYEACVLYFSTDSFTHVCVHWKRGEGGGNKNVSTQTYIHVLNLIQHIFSCI